MERRRLFRERPFGKTHISMENPQGGSETGRRFLQARSNFSAYERRRSIGFRKKVNIIDIPKWIHPTK